jgi:hypothetical protein
MAPLCCLSSQCNHACTSDTVTHSAGQRHPLLGGAVTVASSLASQRREARTERLRAVKPVAGRCPCRSSSFPRERGETSRNDARDVRSDFPCGVVASTRGMLQRQRTLACRYRVGAHLR